MGNSGTQVHVDTPHQHSADLHTEVDRHPAAPVPELPTMREHLVMDAIERHHRHHTKTLGGDFHAPMFEPPPRIGGTHGNVQLAQLTALHLLQQDNIRFVPEYRRRDCRDIHPMAALRVPGDHRERRPPNLAHNNQSSSASAPSSALTERRRAV